MLEKILTKSFRRLLEFTYKDIQNQLDRREIEELEEDKVRIQEDLLDTIDPYPSNIILENDFVVAAIDGSGNSNLATFDDVRVHLLSASTILLNTNTTNGQLFEPLDNELVTAEIGEQPHLDTHWHSGVRDDARAKLAETLERFYPEKDVGNIILPFFQDHTTGSINTKTDIGKSLEYGKYIKYLQNIEELVSRGQKLTNPAIHDELRTVLEYSAARNILTSTFQPKYLLLDGALSVFLHHNRKYPSMPSGFMLREICSLARKKGTILAAVSKNHTIPFAHKIANMAKEKFGDGGKWFCLLPSREEPGGTLRILENRSYVPPTLAIPYLFSFSRDNRPSRIDFDRIWWRENIFVPNDPLTTRINEKALFQELEFMSRDARWYGYPVALGLAHENCKIGFDDMRLAKEIFQDVTGRKTTSLREDYDM